MVAAKSALDIAKNYKRINEGLSAAVIADDRDQIRALLDEAGALGIEGKEAPTNLKCHPLSEKER